MFNRFLLHSTVFKLKTLFFSCLVDSLHCGALDVAIVDRLKRWGRIIVLHCTSFDVVNAQAKLDQAVDSVSKEGRLIEREASR